MYIERTISGYDRGQQVARSARFLILVQRDSTREPFTCEHCSGFGRYVANADDPEFARVVDCNRCDPIKCAACAGKGWTYDETDPDATAQTCEPCHGKGTTGSTGIATRYVYHKEIRAIVRRVALHQCGHFMMGSARAFGHRIPISGTYGSDGLPRTVPDAVFEKAIPIPTELHERWNNGGGWNGAGSEAPSMVEWALANLDKLEPAR